MARKSEIVKAIKTIREREEEQWKKAVWCKEHGMILDELKHRAIEKELRRVCSDMQDMFDVGYVSIEDDK